MAAVLRGGELRRLARHAHRLVERLSSRERLACSVVVTRPKVARGQLLHERLGEILRAMEEFESGELADFNALPGDGGI